MIDEEPGDERSAARHAELLEDRFEMVLATSPGSSSPGPSTATSPCGSSSRSRRGVVFDAVDLFDVDDGRIRRLSNWYDLVYARKAQGAAVRALMRQKHPEAEFVAVNKHFVNPFRPVRRRHHVPHGHESALQRD